MKTRLMEVVLVLMAAVLFGCGVLRAQKREDAAIRSWTTFVMSALVVSAGCNIAIRSQKIAIAVVAISTVFLLLAFAAALLSQADRNPHPVPAVIRSMVFLLLLSLIGWIQMQPSGPSTDLGQRANPRNGTQPIRSETNPISPEAGSRR